MAVSDNEIVVRDQKVAGSNPVTSTTFIRICESKSGFLFLIFGQTGHNRTFPFSDAKGKQPTIVDLCTLLSALVALSVKSGHGQM